MSANDIIVLNSTLQQNKSATYKSLSDSEFFEIFSFEQSLKNFDLSYDELLSGRIGGADDGGIDGVFAFVDEELLDEDTDLTRFRKGAALQLLLIQAKQTASFEESVLDKVFSTLANLFDLEKNSVALRKMYNSKLVNKALVFRQAYINLAAKHATTSISFVYASKGDIGELHPKLSEKASHLKAAIVQWLSGASANVTFRGARELLESAQKEKTYTLLLKLIENPITTGENSYITLVNLRDYGTFVSDSGALRKYIFESNVRDWQGDVEVNKDIRKTLGTKDSLNFWWLNNGITILCSKATIAGKTVSMDDVQIVNGLQTTVTIHEYLKDCPDSPEHRAVLVRIIETSDPEARDRIIKATNHQTAIPAASLKATDRIQRDMEVYFKQRGWYYDRRKNYYKNLGMPAEKIISIPYLAQSVMAVLLQEPDNARARPTTLIKNEHDYKRVFNENIGFDIYLFCIRLIKCVEQQLRDLPEDQTMAHFWGIELRNYRFHIAMIYVATQFQNGRYKPTDLKKFADETVDDSRIKDAIDNVAEGLASFMSDRDSPSMDKIAKSNEFVLYLLSQFEIA
ncbi:MAG TPA: AIPR family protein [Candidatus Angelobacter sp.]|jgi:hypothetical protein